MAAECNAPDFSEFKGLSLKDLKQKLVDLGLDTKGTKAELLVKEWRSTWRPLRKEVITK